MHEEILRLENINKSFDGTPVLQNISLSVEKGEFITFLGPSGCGKTTMLRIISGLLPPDSGRVFLNGADITRLAPDKRSVNTVFQNYALFPHMNVAKNVAYGLKIRGVPKAQRRQKVAEMLEIVKLSGFEKKMPDTLSGGQKQRVAIARAAVNSPDVLLLDEPLGALDLQLRKYLQTELKRIQKQLGITFIYITHDQEEAMNMSDRIVVMHEGRLEQIGTPREVYDRPKTAFAAQFVGMSNLLSCRVQSQNGNMLTVLAEDTPLSVFAADRTFAPGAQLTVSVRSEKLSVETVPQQGAIPVTVLENVYANGLIKSRLETKAGTVLTAIAPNAQAPFDAGDRVFVRFSPDSGVIVDLEEAAQ